MQESKKPIIQSIRDYVMLNPDIDDRKINIDYLGDGMEYSIDPIGADPVYKRYTDGTCLKQFQFAFTSKEAYDGDARTGIANSGFYQAFEEWVESNNMNDILPELDGHDATRVDVLQSGYLFSAEVDLGRYQMICRVHSESTSERRTWSMGKLCNVSVHFEWKINRLAWTSGFRCILWRCSRMGQICRRFGRSWNIYRKTSTRTNSCSKSNQSIHEECADSY